MIRGRKEGHNYATWFIGFDHELPQQSPRTPVHNKPVSRATSLETLVHSYSPRETRLPPRSLTPAATQTYGTASAASSTQTAVGTPSWTGVDAPTQTNRDTPTQTQTSTSHASTDASSEIFDGFLRRSRTPDLGGARPRSHDFDAHRSKRRRDKDTQGLYKEAFDGAKRSEEFKFRVKFNELLVDLHQAIEEKHPNGLSTGFASLSYGEVLLTFRGKVKDLLKGYIQRLQLAHESFGTTETPEDTGQRVKQDVTRFIEDLIGETLELTSDEAVSDLSSLSDDSSPEQTSFEDLIAQAIVTKLLENHRNAVTQSLQSSNNINNGSSRVDVQDQLTSSGEVVIKRQQRQASLDSDESDGHQNRYEDFVDGHKSQLIRGSYQNNHSSPRSSRTLSNPDLTNLKSDLSYDLSRHKSDLALDYLGHRQRVGGEDFVKQDVISLSESGRKITKDHNNHESGDAYVVSVDNGELDNEKDNTVDNDEDSEIDIVKEFEELKKFVEKTQQSARPIVESKDFDDSNLCEIQEETLCKITVDRDENLDDFHTRYSAFERVQNSEPPLPDFSQFENINFNTNEIDPDLLSMNLAIIPEETEEELEQEGGEEEDDEQGRWRANWIFKGKGVSPYENMGKKTVTIDSAAPPIYMMVPQPDDSYVTRLGSRDLDQVSDLSDSDVLSRSDLDGSDDDENTFYANTSKELARISGHRKHHGSHHPGPSSILSDDSDFTGRALRGSFSRSSQNYEDMVDDIPASTVSGPLVEPTKQELKLLTDLVPADDDDPKFLVPPESVTIQEGEPVKFSCRVGGTPSVDVFWYREGEEVEEFENSEDVEISSSGDNHSIVLYNMSKKMAGQYMCIALNEKGKAVQYLVVTIRDSKQELKKPEFIKGMKDVEVTEGQSVKLRVKVKGYPPPRISWYKDGALLQSSRSCRIEKFGNRDYILTIDYATMNDDAEYTVSARNVAGEERMSAQVIVEPQSDLPPRRQRVSSVTTSGASDSDSDRASSYRAFKSPEPVPPSSTVSRLTSSSSSFAASAKSPLSSSPLPSAASAMKQREEQLHINHLDRKISLTEKRVKEEAGKMAEDSEKGDEGDNKKLLSPTALDILKTAEEIIQSEISRTGSDQVDSSSQDLKREGSLDASASQDKTNGASTLPPSLTSQSDNAVKELTLPDTLDDFFTPSVKTSKSPVTSTFEFSLPKRDEEDHDESPLDDFEFSLGEKSAPEKFKSEVSFGKQHKNNSSPSSHDTAVNQTDNNVNNLSFDSGQGASLPDNSTSLASSVSSSTSSRDGADLDASELFRQQALMSREQYSRDFEVPRPAEKKKWSVTLDPFVPHAPVVNRQSSTEKTDEKEPITKVSFTNLSPSSSLRSSKGDNPSLTSSPRQSVDSGVSVSSKAERPPPVHMVGHTSESDMPESRTEFNTDGSIELPSVQRLKAMFSNPKDDDFGDGSFKRIHSITARSVPKEQLEKLRAVGGGPSSSSPTSSSTSSNHLQVPGLSPSQPSSSSSKPKLSTVSVRLSSDSSSSPVPSPTSKVTLRPLPVSSLSDSQQQQQQQQTPPTSADGSYCDIDPEKYPVLIYPETDPEYFQRHHLQPQQQQQEQLQQESSVKPLSAKTTRAPLPPQQQQPSSSSPSASATAGASSKESKLPAPAKPLRAQQARLVVRRALPEDENSNTITKGPRIKSGCISARAAFWERRMVDGGDVDNEEFPEMVEEGNS